MRPYVRAPEFIPLLPFLNVSKVSNLGLHAFPASDLSLDFCLLAEQHQVGSFCLLAEQHQGTNIDLNISIAHLQCSQTSNWCLLLELLNSSGRCSWTKG